jgi:hypothetical protein
MINITNNLTSPVRQVKGKVELLNNSTTVTGETINITTKPQNIKCVVSSKNKIYFPYHEDSQTINGITYTINSDGSVTANGTATMYSFWYLAQNYQIPKGTYILSSINTTSKQELRGTVYNLDGTPEKYLSGGSFTITEDKLIDIYFVFLKGDTVNTTYKPILELGSEATEYTPFISDLTTITVNVNGTEYTPDANGVVNDIVIDSNMVFTVSPGGFMEVEYAANNFIFVDSTFNYTDALKSINIERVGESKFFGFGICQKANIHLIDKDRLLDITTANGFKVYFDDVCNYPNFYVTEVHRDENTNELSITAYDKIYAAATHTVAELGLVTPYTISGVANACAALLGLNAVNIIGITEENSPFDREYIEEANFEGTETIRAALNAIAEATQTIYYIDKDENLVFKRLDVEGAAVLTIGKHNYITLDSKTNRRLSAICSATELGDNVIASMEQSGSTQYVRDNPFWDTQEDINILVENALAAIGGLTINQFECKWRGNYALEPGDKINIITKDGGFITSYLLDDVIDYNGAFAETSQWSYEDNEGESVDNPSTLGEALKYTFAKVDKVNKEIELVVSEVEGFDESISSIQMTTNNITASVGDLNNDIGELSEKVNATLTSEDVQIAIQQELADGVEKVVTTTGFIFNDEGLMVSKTGSEMTTQITEDGMTVFRDSGEVLTADNTGVKAENLTATTYLIVGVNSRFENYDNGNRTGCFWIGG